MIDASWREVTVLDVRAWDDGLVSLTLDAQPEFVPGQFAQMGLVGPDGHFVHRAYSIASAPGAPLELFVVRVDGGALSPRLVTRSPGDRIFLKDKITGFFTLDGLVDPTTLWLVATGTGLAPYLSMLRHGGLDAYARVVVVHGVRTAAQLAYAEELATFAADPRVRYLRVVSRERVADGYAGRIPAALSDGWLESTAAATLDARAHVMLCGNPEMVKDLTGLLEARGLRRHKRREPGQIVTERYW